MQFSGTLGNAAISVTDGHTLYGTFALPAAPAPEPGTVVLLATGLMGLLAYAWRKRK